MRIPLILAASLLLTACGPSREDRIVVGSKNFTEQLILGEIIAQQIENQTHLPVERRFYLAGTYICQQAMLGGRDRYLSRIHRHRADRRAERKTAGTQRRCLQPGQNRICARFNLAVGPTFGFNDTFAIEIRGDDARRLGLQTISQAAAYTPKWRAGFGYEFMERPDGYKGLAAAYGLHFAEPPQNHGPRPAHSRPKRQASGFDRRQHHRWPDPGAGLDLFSKMTSTTFLRTKPCPSFASKPSTLIPKLEQALHQLAGKISDDDMRQLNYAVDGQHRDVKEVVREFLAEKAP